MAEVNIRIEEQDGKRCLGIRCSCGCELFHVDPVDFDAATNKQMRAVVIGELRAEAARHLRESGKSTCRIV